MKTQSSSLSVIFRIFLVSLLVFPMILSAQQKIRFKNGHEETGTVISRVNDTIRYQLAGEPGVIRIATASQVDTILTLAQPLQTDRNLTLGSPLQKGGIPLSDTLLADDINRSLKAATVTGALSFACVAAGAGLILSSVTGSGATSADDASRRGLNIFMGLFIHIGGFGMSTNVPILTNRAYRQLGSWNCPADKAVFKSGVMKDIRLAKLLSTLQTLTPLAALAGVLLSSYFINKDITWAVFGSIYAAGSLLVVPEIVLIEHARHALNDYTRKCSIGSTDHGIGISYNF